MATNLYIIIHTHNEEKNIEECIKSAKILSENIIVIDSESTDQTTQLAKDSNVTVKAFPFSRYVETAREFGIQQAQTDWVFILDADERMTEELANEINKIITNYQLRITNSSKIFLLPTHYSVPRKNIFGKNKWLKHGGWWPDRQIRLIYKPAFKSWPAQIHSTPLFEGTSEELKHPILHYFHGNLHEMVEKTLTFEDIESELLLNANKKARIFTFFRKFAGELFRRLIRDQGFLDGTVGIIESVYQAYSKTITYLFLYEKQHASKTTQSRTV